MKYYSLLKRNELLSHTNMDPIYVSLSERTQAENAIYCMIPTIRHPGKGKTMRQ